MRRREVSVSEVESQVSNVTHRTEGEVEVKDVARYVSVG